MAYFNQIKSILKLRSCSRQSMESHVPFILSNCKIYLSKGVNILLGQPVHTQAVRHTLSVMGVVSLEHRGACYFSKPDSMHM